MLRKDTNFIKRDFIWGQNVNPEKKKKLSASIFKVDGISVMAVRIRGMVTWNAITQS